MTSATHNHPKQPSPPAARSAPPRRVTAPAVCMDCTPCCIASAARTPVQGPTRTCGHPHLRENRPRGRGLWWRRPPLLRRWRCARRGLRERLREAADGVECLRCGRRQRGDGRLGILQRFEASEALLHGCEGRRQPRGRCRRILLLLRAHQARMIIVLLQHPPGDEAALVHKREVEQPSQRHERCHLQHSRSGFSGRRVTSDRRRCDTRGSTSISTAILTACAARTRPGVPTLLILPTPQTACMHSDRLMAVVGNARVILTRLTSGRGCSAPRQQRHSSIPYECATLPEGFGWAWRSPSGRTAWTSSHRSRIHFR